jgi:outer membrane lipoprotein-sorting protein
LNKKIRIATVFTLAAALCPLFGQAQEIQTAENYFDGVSDRYSKIQDYSAGIVISREDTVMQGNLYYKKPRMLRIDFQDPEEQVLVTDGELLTIYIPKYEVIMEQKLKRKSQAGMAGLATEAGLTLLKKNYGVSFLTGPNPVPLEESPQEMVVQLKLTSRSTAEGFRQIIISVGGNGLIRRITGVTLGYEELTFDFLDIMVNQGIPDTRFQYDSPAYANVYQNFLYETDD